MRKVVIINESDEYYNRFGFAEVINHSVAVYFVEDGQVVSRAYEKSEIRDIGKVSVYWATYLAYQRMPARFPAWKFVEIVRQFMKRPYRFAAWRSLRWLVGR